MVEDVLLHAAFCFVSLICCVLYLFCGAAASCWRGAVWRWRARLELAEELQWRWPSLTHRIAVAKSLFAVEKQFLARQRLSAPLGPFEARPERPLLKAARLVIIPAGDEVAMQQREAAHVPGGFRIVLAQFERAAKASDGFRGAFQLHQGDGALMEPVEKFVERRFGRVGRRGFIRSRSQGERPLEISRCLLITPQFFEARPTTH